MQAEKLDKISIEEYIAFEQASNKKCEYLNGFVSVSEDKTLNYAFISGNIFVAVKRLQQQKNKTYTALNSQIKIYIKAQNSYVYPAAMVVCGDIETSDRKPDAVTNPTVIIEVLSKSTAAYDRGDKFYLYRQIESLREYILVEQEKAEIEVYTKKGDLWQITRYTGMDTKLFLSSIDVTINLSEIYENVVFTTN
jgi:Uma2 family endonuclease